MLTKKASRSSWCKSVTLTLCNSVVKGMKLSLYSLSSLILLKNAFSVVEEVLESVLLPCSMLVYRAAMVSIVFSKYSDSSFAKREGDELGNGSLGVFRFVFRETNSVSVPLLSI